MDVVIVGGGIAGLYAAHRLLQRTPTCRILLLEKNTTLGGRAGAHSFAGTTVLTGAGVGRKNKDKRLAALLKELHLPFRDFVATQQLAPTLPPIPLKKVFFALRRAYRATGSPRVSFVDFALTHLDRDTYHHFVQASGYSDYEQADAEDVLYRYGFDDNFSDWDAMGISWVALVERLAKRIEAARHVSIVKSANVTKIVQSDEQLRVHYGSSSSSSSSVLCSHVIVATTVDTVRRLLPDNPLYQHIHGQPFLRIYGQFSKKCRHLLPVRTTVLPGPLHKFIPMNPEKGVYMIAYTDNADARRVARLAHSLPQLCKLLETSLGLADSSLELLKTHIVPWSIGTHFYDADIPPEYQNRRAFVHAAQRPHPRISVVGEMVSLSNQGWVEGALESVDSLLCFTQK